MTAKAAFIIGVWYQPVSSFGKWKARGVNTLVGYENEGGNVSRNAWTAAARNAGLTYITQPSSTVAADSNDPYLLAWSQVDEPDGAGSLSPAQIQAAYATLKRQSTKAVFLNLDGAQIQWRPAADYIAYAKGGDILAFDYYVANRGGAPQEIPVIGTRTAQLKTWSSNKPVLAFIESSNQQLYLQSWVAGTALATLMRAPTPAEMQAQIDQAVSHGASGIVYFPDIIGLGWGGFDGTTTALEAQMKSANTALMKTYSAPKPN